MEANEKVCECGKKFNARSTYYAHRKSCVCAKNDRDCGNFICNEKNCNYKSKLSHDFRMHLQDAHGIEMSKDIKDFQKYSDFKVWKEAFEKQTKALFVVANKRKNHKERIEYFYCNRSGNYKSVSTGKRSLKSQGCRKIGYNCPASIKVRIDNESGKIITTIHSSHYGHDNKLCHLPIPGSDRQKIACELSQGIQHSRVIKNLFSSEVTELERKHLCTKRDLLNISKAYGIEKIEKHANDHISVDAYVEENLEENILMYKRQGEENMHHPKSAICTLEKEDFALGIMTKFQKQILQEFGANVVCLDATHGTNFYNFNLITVLVVDEFREGIPVSWLICNKENSTALNLFFNHIKREVGNIVPRLFMSDKAPQYFNSWYDVFPGATQKLLCHWHVHRDWQRNMNKIKDKETASAVYKSLCLLLGEGNQAHFENLLVKFCEHLNENQHTSEFAKYFNNEWLKIKEQWAKCFRIGSGINTNMFVESFHRTLKYGENYLKGKQGKRVDECVSILLQFSKDLAIKRLIKLEKGVNNWKTAEIRKRHKAAAELPDSLFQKISETTWKIISSKSADAETTESEYFYLIQKQPKCTQKCQIKCHECNICLHDYSCNCPDGLTSTNICKHIHLIVMGGKKTVEELEMTAKEKYPNIDISVKENISDSSTCLDKKLVEQDAIMETLNKEIGGTGDIEVIRQSCMEKYMLLHEKIKNCEDRNLLIQARASINNVYNLLQLSTNTNNSILQKKINIPSNKNIGKQHRFFTTRKPRNKKKVRFAKPTSQEKTSLESNLLNDNCQVPEEDHSYSAIQK